MKNTLHKISVVFGAIAAMVLMSLLSACRHEPSDLNLFGEWQEREYAVYDTTFSSSAHHLFIDCPQSTRDTAGAIHKDGDFRLYIKSTHQPSLLDSNNILTITKFTYTEYVMGTYSLNENKSEVVFKGIYYTDSTFSRPCDKDNTDYSFGSYEHKTPYKLNDITLTLYLNDTTGYDLNTFTSVSQYTNCF